MRALGWVCKLLVFVVVFGVGVEAQVPAGDKLLSSLALTAAGFLPSGEIPTISGPRNVGASSPSANAIVRRILDADDPDLEEFEALPRALLRPRANTHSMRLLVAAAGSQRAAMAEQIFRCYAEPTDGEGRVVQEDILLYQGSMRPMAVRGLNPDRPNEMQVRTWRGAFERNAEEGDDSLPDFHWCIDETNQETGGFDALNISRHLTVNLSNTVGSDLSLADLEEAISSSTSEEEKARILIDRFESSSAGLGDTTGRSELRLTASDVDLGTLSGPGDLDARDKLPVNESFITYDWRPFIEQSVVRIFKGTTHGSHLNAAAIDTLVFPEVPEPSSTIEFVLSAAAVGSGVVIQEILVGGALDRTRLDFAVAKQEKRILRETIRATLVFLLVIGDLLPSVLVLAHEVSVSNYRGSLITTSASIFRIFSTTEEDKGHVNGYACALGVQYYRTWVEDARVTEAILLTVGGIMLHLILFGVNLLSRRAFRSWRPSSEQNSDASASGGDVGTGEDNTAVTAEPRRSGKTRLSRLSGITLPF